MASTKCWKCKDRPASRVGGFCHTCWAAAGKPSRDEVEKMRSGAVPTASLSTETSGTLPSMRFVVANPPAADVSHEQRAMREWRETSPSTFFARLAALEQAEAGKQGNGSTGTGPATWSGEGPCPTCNRKPGPVVGPDPKGPELERLMDDCLADLDARMAAADAEFMAQPGAEKLGATLKEKLAESQDHVRRLKERIRELEGRARLVPA